MKQEPTWADILHALEQLSRKMKDLDASVTRFEAHFLPTQPVKARRRLADVLPFRRRV